MAPRFRRHLQLSCAERAYSFNLSGKRDPNEPAANAMPDLPAPLAPAIAAITAPAYVLDRLGTARLWIFALIAGPNSGATRAAMPLSNRAHVPLIGLTALTVLPELLRSYAEYKEFISGIILLMFIVLLPTGLVGLANRGAAALMGWTSRR